MDFKIFVLYFQKKIDLEELRNSLFSMYELDRDVFLNSLNDAYKTKDSFAVECLVNSFFILEKTDVKNDYLKCVEVLNELLISKWHKSNEDIVGLLEIISDESSLEYLFRAIDLDLDYLSWDVNHSFEKKCIHAIVKIGKQKSEKYLRLICNNHILTIRDCALKQLDRISNQSNQIKEIRAVYGEHSVRVYQAFNKEIASEISQLGTFGKSFDMERMTWIKPSFLWMMYRSGWATKENQENIIAIDIRRDGFDYLVNHAVLTTYQEKVYGSEAYWRYKVNSTDVLCQWDPDRDVYGNPVEARAIQIGIRGSVLKKFISDWIMSIENITDYVFDLKTKIDMGKDISALLPKESVYKAHYRL